MATSKIVKMQDVIKTRYYTFNNLIQYSPGSYYLTIDDVRTKAGLPKNAQVISASLAGWGGLGTGPNVEVSTNDKLWIFFSPGSNITENSYAEVRFCYA